MTIIIDMELPDILAQLNEAADLLRWDDYASDEELAALLSASDTPGSPMTPDRRHPRGLADPRR